MAAKASLYEKADKRIRKWAGTIGAIATILTALAGVCAWASSQFAKAVSDQISSFQQEVRDADKKTETQITRLELDQISSFQQEVRDADKKTETQITRLELMTLIDTQPTNAAEIEKVAKHYFKDLGADWYMTSIYSNWAREYGGDISIVIGVD